MSTPIGNLDDLTDRAREVLAAADRVACEDTRRTGRLLAGLGISQRLVSYHDHSSPAVRAGLIECLRKGELVALVSDGGTPLISDPGFKLVRDAVQSGIPVTCAPGPSSVLAALVISGLPSDRFFFVGYLPRKEQARREALREISAVRATLIFLESARRLTSALKSMTEILGDRSAAVAREITKLHEDVRRDTLRGLLTSYGEEDVPKGEMVVVVGPPEPGPDHPVDLDPLLDEALRTMGLRDAATMVSEVTGRPRREVYNHALRRGASEEESEC